jgi:Uma2 family endonuclease
MEAVLSKKRYRNHFTKREIPKALIYEVYDGKPMYYKGFKDVLNNKINFESIMGSSSIQGIIISSILKFIYRNLNEDKHHVVTNEFGLHLDKGSNVASDILIYDKSDLQNSKIDNHYSTLPPLAVIEVDIEADVFDFGINEFNYYSMKTERLLNFGVKEVFWFFSERKQVAIARPNQDWIITNWNKELVVLDEYKFSLNNLLDKDGFKI